MAHGRGPQGHVAVRRWPGDQRKKKRKQKKKEKERKGKKETEGNKKKEERKNFEIPTWNFL